MWFSLMRIVDGKEEWMGRWMGGNGGGFELHVELCGECVVFDEREMGLVWVTVCFVRRGGWRNASWELVLY